MGHEVRCWIHLVGSDLNILGVYTGHSCENTDESGDATHGSDGRRPCAARQGEHSEYEWRELGQQLHGEFLEEVLLVYPSWIGGYRENEMAGLSAYIRHVLNSETSL